MLFFEKLFGLKNQSKAAGDATGLILSGVLWLRKDLQAGFSRFYLEQIA